ncbi:GNAT family N-acetyltransferase [Butyrivibrio sp. INlla16]|uniref:GNAT family N-acetyltransferase n=1 Tax=Butyrivibrio sp. INlla16 TaxID=1520807 RepID=UPI000881643E|nr:GNAT family N-acetyltransferase [Butyrivibrio sp. INlla16]SDB69610.1 Acetyltransferase (GNAT) domain-containing protein [Butyrivibrio sp. INlla16]
MMNVTFDTANKKDISELTRLRIAYIMDDYGTISEADKYAMEEQLPGYFVRKLGKELIAFVARADGQLVATAYLLLIEKPANPSMQNGLVGEVLSVFTEKKYRGQGISTRLMNDLINYGKENRLCYIDLKATEEGYSLYKNIGFEERNQKYKNMRLKL